jgi:hypothetical protein
VLPESAGLDVLIKRRSDESQHSNTNDYRHDAQRYSGDCPVGFTAFDTAWHGQAHHLRE